MSYEVLARKWRPRTFRELVGQEATVRTLSNALDNDRLHHAFLFTGTRGVGKTTISRIFAKALNCQQGVSATPCGECASCREITEGRFVDLIEVDAASRTKVEDTRELLENVQYSPTRGRYKVYLIDEVHMLSGHSFNALLKTLEEPPPHVKFLLATTDPQRLPVTILSRCLQFNLKRLPATLIAAHLEQILAQENIICEQPALRLIAQAGEGSMRDALSLLDQAIAFGGGQVTQDAVSTMLGAIDKGQILALLNALATNDAAATLKQVAELDQSAPDYATVLAELISLLQRVALNQAIPGDLDDGAPEAVELQTLATALTPEELQLFYQIALIGRRDLPLSPDPRGGFEMILLRMLCFRPVDGERSAPPPPAPATRPAKPAATEAVVPRPPPVTRPPPEQASASDWSALVAQLGLSGMAQQLALNCVLQRHEDDILYLLVDPSCAMLIKSAEQRLRAALSDYFGRPVRLQIEVGRPQDGATPAQQQLEQNQKRQQAAAETLNQDHNVQAMQEKFNARLNPDSIMPVDD